MRGSTYHKSRQMDSVRHATHAPIASGETDIFRATELRKVLHKRVIVRRIVHDERDDLTDTDDSRRCKDAGN